MKNINEHNLCILKRNEHNGITFDYFAIERPFKHLVDNIQILCDKKESTVKEICNYLMNYDGLNEMNGTYGYCLELSKPFQGVMIDNKKYIGEIAMRYQKIIDDNFESKDRYLEDIKKEIRNNYLLWERVYSIEKAYDKCKTITSLIAYSHRIKGWSNPVFQLTEHFSVEIKTNFGYGKSSYFFTKLKYKDIHIIPFSEWIYYQYANYQEIIRYTRCYDLVNSEWEEVMRFCAEACNVSLQNEKKFVEKYIIAEFEAMAVGLENILKSNEFSFFGKNRKKYISKIENYDLSAFRGEKISGALDFIEKILEYKNIADVYPLIRLIEKCNKTIHPVLIKENRSINLNIEKINNEINSILPNYESAMRTMNEYKDKKQIVLKELIANKAIANFNIESKEFEDLFNVTNPEYKDFKINVYDPIIIKYNKLLSQRYYLNEIREKINKYIDKIIKYFDNIELNKRRIASDELYKLENYTSNMLFSLIFSKDSLQTLISVGLTGVYVDDFLKLGKYKGCLFFHFNIKDNFLRTTKRGVEAEGFMKQILQFKSFNDFYETDEGTMVVFKVNTSFEKDIMLFRKGEFSKFSKHFVDNITYNNGDLQDIKIDLKKEIYRCE